MPTPLLSRVARKTVTRIQPGSVYKERFTIPSVLPAGSTARTEFFDSAGSLVAEVVGTVEGRHVLFHIPYLEVEPVPNGAGFYTYVHIEGEPVEDEHMIAYGSVFRRQLTFPSSVARSAAAVSRRLNDDFQRPAGSLGGRWKTLVGRPVIFTNLNAPNTVGPLFPFLSRYYTYYYTPLNSDTVDLAISCVDKGEGVTIVTVCGNVTANSYLYMGFHALTRRVELGYGTHPDIGAFEEISGALHPEIEPVSIPLTTLPNLSRFRLRYDDVTKELAVYNSDLTTKYASWVDEENFVPHGRGYRYVGIGGNSTVLDSGVQVAHLEAMDAV